MIIDGDFDLIASNEQSGNIWIYLNQVDPKAKNGWFIY
mgnify:CR=1 FL=1